MAIHEVQAQRVGRDAIVRQKGVICRAGAWAESQDMDLGIPSAESILGQKDLVHTQSKDLLHLSPPPLPASESSQSLLP